MLAFYSECIRKQWELILIWYVDLKLYLLTKMFLNVICKC